MNDKDLKEFEKITINQLKLINEFKKLKNENIKLNKINKRLLIFKLEVINDKFYLSLTEEQKQFIKDINT